MHDSNDTVYNGKIQPGEHNQGYDYFSRGTAPEAEGPRDQPPRQDGRVIPAAGRPGQQGKLRVALMSQFLELNSKQDKKPL